MPLVTNMAAQQIHLESLLTKQIPKMVMEKNTI